MAFGQACAKAERARRGAGDAHTRRQRAWNQHRERVAPLRLAVEMGGEVDGRIPTAGHGKQIAGETLGLAARVADHDAAHAMAAAHLLDRGAREVAGLRRLRRRLHARRGALSCIDQRDHRNARLGEILGRAEGVVVVGEDHRAPAGCDTVTIQVGAHGAGQHDARPVVIAEDDGPLDRARRQHRALGHDAPQPLARRMRGRLGDMIVDALDRGVGAAVVDALHGGAAQDAAIGQALELHLRRLHPIGRGTPVDLVTLREQPPTEAEILLAQHHPRAGSRGGECRRQTRGPTADHQHVAKGVSLFIVIRVRRLRCAAEPRGAADGRLVELLPEGGRPHEGLVVEAGAEDRREDLVRRQQVEAQRRPAILARRGKPVIKLDSRRPGVRFAPRTRPQLDQRVRLLGPRSQRFRADDDI